MNLKKKQGMNNSKQKKCKWKQDAIYGYWETGCGKQAIVAEDTPKENDMNYCWYCGKELEEIL